jgi:uncharacterized protein with HEPN domain
MTQPDELYLRHMLDAMDRVIELTQRTSFEEFELDWVVQDALLHELQVVGEAAGRVSKGLADAHPLVPWRKITGLRHKIVHEYFVVDLQVVWDTATLDVPEVRPLLADLLK